MIEHEVNAGEGKFGMRKRTYDEHMTLEREQKSILDWD